MLKREEIARIKEMYPKGTPIRLYSMEGEQSVPCLLYTSDAADEL